MFDYFYPQKRKKRRHTAKRMRRAKRVIANYRKKNPDSPFGYTSKTRFRLHKYLGI